MRVSTVPLSQSTITKKKEKEEGSIERIPTGDSVLDSYLSGGFPRNRVIYVTGNPGTGKTLLASTFIYRGAKNHDEIGLYFSFSETKEVFYSDMKAFGFDFQSLEESKKFEYIELLTTSKLTTSTISEKIVAALIRLQPKRLVIDSFSSIAQAQDNPYKARQMMDTIFSKLISFTGCTTLVIGEQPTGESGLGIGSEEFVSDGVLNLKHTLPREMEIRKMRGTKIGRDDLLYTINMKGFQTLKTNLATPDRPKKWKPISDSGNLLSTGSPDLDRVIGGGFPSGTYVVVEAESNVSLEEINLLSHGIAMNFISQGRGAVFSTTGEEAGDGIRNLLVPYLTDESVSQYLRVVEYNIVTARKSKPHEHLITNVSDDLGYQRRFSEVYGNLKKTTGRQPIFHWVGYDTLAGNYAMIASEKVVHKIGSAIAKNRDAKDLTIVLARPSLNILGTIVDIANWHLKLWKKNGVLLFQGIKPETRIYAIDSYIGLGYPVMRLTELN